MSKKSTPSISGSMVWNLLERLGAQGTQLLVSIILARLLMPEAYGILALITVFINLATVVVETGFGSSIIQKKDITPEQINIVFTLNIAVATLLCGILWLAAPLIASFYSNFDRVLLIWVIRIYALILPIGSITSIQSAVIYRNMEFKKFFLVNLISIILSSVIGITMAYMNCGVWALIAQNLSAKAILLVCQLFVVKWKPRLDFHFRQSGSMFRFGSNILLNRLLSMMYHQISSLVIGKAYTPDALAYYTKGNTFPSIIATNTDYALQKVMFSAYAKHQDNLAKVRELMRKTIRLSTFVLSPLMFGMLSCSENFIRVILTDKWLPAQIYMQIFCISFFLQPIGTTAAQALNGIGRSDLTLKIGLITKLSGIGLVLIATPLGVTYIALAVLMTSTVSSVTHLLVNRKIFDYRIRRQLMDLAENILPSVTMALVCFAVGYFCRSFAPIAALALQVLAGTAWYLCWAVIFRNDNLKYLIQKLKSLKK